LSDSGSAPFTPPPFADAPRRFWIRLGLFRSAVRRRLRCRTAKSWSAGVPRRADGLPTRSTLHAAARAEALQLQFISAGNCMACAAALSPGSVHPSRRAVLLGLSWGYARMRRAAIAGMLFDWGPRSSRFLQASAEDRNVANVQADAVRAGGGAFFALQFARVRFRSC
jgi:hypothetical protein